MQGRTHGVIVIASIALLSGGTVTAQSDTSDDGQREAQVVLPMGRLVFTSDRGGDDLDLWMYEAGDPEPIQLTSGKGRDRTPALSPDGTIVAFSTDRENLDGMQVQGSDLRWYDLYTVGTDGSEPCPHRVGPGADAVSARSTLGAAAPVSGGLRLDDLDALRQARLLAVHHGNFAARPVRELRVAHAVTSIDDAGAPSADERVASHAAGKVSA